MTLRHMSLWAAADCRAFLPSLCVAESSACQARWGLGVALGCLSQHMVMATEWQSVMSQVKAWMLLSA